MNRCARKAGFTLVEILIVVVILGILAAIVIPQFSSASDQAKLSSLKTQIQTIRTQLELYQTQHGGAFPNLADWTQLTGKTNAAGTVGTTAGTHTLGPYLQKAPMNPFTNSTSVVTTGNPAATDGWLITTAAGTSPVVKAALPAATATSLGLDLSAAPDNNDFIATGS